MSDDVRADPTAPENGPATGSAGSAGSVGSVGPPPPAPRPRFAERGTAIGAGLAWLATWSLRLLLVALGAVLLGVVVGQLWSVVLPALLALLLASVLWPPTAWLRRRGTPPALAALLVLLVSLGLVGGTIAMLAPSVSTQLVDIAGQAAGGLQRVQEWVTGPPLRLDDAQVQTAVQAITDRLQSSATRVAAGVLTGVTVALSALVTAALTLVLTFFFLKDGPRFLPWLRGVVGDRAADHLDVVLTRSWATLGSFIQGQAVVGLVDAVLIGIGLVVLGVPLALALSVLTFFGGFVPIIGAFVVGGLAVLVALVTQGPTTALIVLVIIVAVQQVEGNVLQPVLQGRSLRLHPGLVILVVTAGGSLYGVAGAFLSVPATAVAAVVIRYLGEVVDGRTGRAARAQTDAEQHADDGGAQAEPDAADKS